MEPASQTNERGHIIRPRLTRPAAYVLVLLLSLVAVACTGGEGTTWRRIEREGVLRVGVDPTFPPFANADGEQLEGLDVDLLRALAADHGLEAEFVYFGYDGLYDALGTGLVDVLASALVVRIEQTRDYAYSEPYFNAGQYLVVPTGSADVRNMEDLTGHRLGVELGAEGHVVATEWQRRLQRLTINPYDSPAAALDALAAAEVDAVLVDAISARLYPAVGTSLRLLPEPVTVEPFALVVRKDDEVLLEKLNESLAALADSGQLDRIVDKWFQPAPDNE